VSRVAIVADDFTGANDALATFATAGWRDARTVVDADALARVTSTSTSAPDVVALVSFARHLDHDRAERATATAVSAAMAAGADRVYVKVDSMLRGSVAGQVRGAVRAWRSAHPDAVGLLCPAHPRLGRTVVDGEVRVGGAPVGIDRHGSEIRVPSARITDQVTHARHIGAGRLAEWMSRGEIRSATQGFDVVSTDAASCDDLASLAAIVKASWPSLLPIGSGGLAEALAVEWSPDSVGPPAAAAEGTRTGHERTVVVVTSRHPLARAQVATVEDASAPGSVLRLDVSSRSFTSQPWLAMARAGLSAASADPESRVVILVARADEMGSAPMDPHQFAASMAELAAEAVITYRPTRLVLVGGDGAAACLIMLGANAIRVHGTVDDGVAIGTIVGGFCDTRDVVTKAGSFGDPSSLVRMVDPSAQPVRR
jgi:D-threonate/D-erythronate kinase